jgi:hypothetical protein
MLNPYVLYQLGKERHSEHLKYAESYRIACMTNKSRNKRNVLVNRSLLELVKMLISIVGRNINREVAREGESLHG